MKKKVLIIVPSVRLSQKPTRFPLGLGYVAASFEKCGVGVSVLDLNILRLSNEKEELEVAKATQGMDVVCMGGMITMLNTISRIASYVKKYHPQIPVIVGGPLASNSEEIILRKTQIDILVKGECEEVIPKLLAALSDKNLLQEINGLAFLKNDEFCLTLPPKRIQNIDLLPMPAYHLFPFRTYIQNRGEPYSADIIASRGCPYNCIFCFRNFGKQVAVRSVENLMSEISFLKNNYDIKHIYLQDEIFSSNKEYLIDFCGKMRELRGITWGASIRADSLTLEMLKEMKASACKMLMIGIESFSADRLREMNKKVRLEQIEQVCHWMCQVGIEISPGLIIGMPGETKESIQMTVDGCIRHKIPITEWSFAFATPYPGTKLYSDAKVAGIIKDDWAYIKRLCKIGDTRFLTVNLTKFSDKEIIQIRNNAINIVTKSLQTSLLKRINKLLKRYAIGVYRRIPLVVKKMKTIFGLDATSFHCVSVGHFQENLDKNKSRKLFKEKVKMVEIEIFSFCNRMCWFCSNSIIDRHSKNIRMSEHVYRKILTNLREINYNNQISYSRYNEPLADRIILERLREAHELLPQAKLRLNTNGDYLNKDYLEELYKAGLRSLSIQAYLPDGDKYSDEFAEKYLLSKMKHYVLPFQIAYKRSMEWLEYKANFNDMVIRFYARNFSLNGTDRGGIVTLLKQKKIRESPCLIPFYDMYIDYSGKVVPCCNIRSDWPSHSAYILGDLNNEGETLFSIFTSPQIVKYRRTLISYEKKRPPCDSCRFEEISMTKENLCLANKKSKLLR